MLVVTRKANEEVVIDGEIVVKVISTSNGRVKIGIEAPKNVRIVRGEIAFREELQSDEKLGQEAAVA